MTIKPLITEEEEIDLHRTYTAEEYAALPDDGNHYELIEGKLVMTAATRDEHGEICDTLLFEIKQFLKSNSGVGKVWSHTGFNLGRKPNGKDNVLEPDLGFIVANRVPPRSGQYLPFPDLAIEVWSRDSDLGRPSKLRKARAKLQIYLNFGSSIAWGINPETQEVEVYHQGQITPVRVLTINDELDGEDVIQGFRLKVIALFE